MHCIIKWFARYGTPRPADEIDSEIEGPMSWPGVTYGDVPKLPNLRVLHYSLFWSRFRRPSSSRPMF